MIPIFYHDIVTPSGHPGDEVISALQKFIRRGETELAVRAAYELYLTGEELTAYLWRRLLVISAEDVGLGEPWPQWWWMPFTAAARELIPGQLRLSTALRPRGALSVRLPEGAGLQRACQCG